MAQAARRFVDLDLKPSNDRNLSAQDVVTAINAQICFPERTAKIGVNEYQLIQYQSAAHRAVERFADPRLWREP